MGGAPPFPNKLRLFEYFAYFSYKSTESKGKQEKKFLLLLIITARFPFGKTGHSH
jgi:hypothetical protein